MDEAEYQPEKDSPIYVVNPFANCEIKIEVSDTEPSNPYTLYCSHCNLTFIDSTEFYQHNTEAHGIKHKITGKRKHACEICHATFRRHDHLKRHIKSLHSGQKYCVCPVCERDCKTQDVLLKHIEDEHSTTAEVFHCRECTFQCAALEELERHEQVHILTERHHCPHCETSFKRRDHMLRHIKTLHLLEHTTCPVCGQTYKRKDHVVRHVREKHNMGLVNGKLVDL